VLAVTVVVGFAGSIGLGELAARHVMRMDPPGGLDEADTRARLAAGARWWKAERVPLLLPNAHLPGQANSAHGQSAVVERTVLAGKGDTLIDLLLRGGASNPEAHDAADAIQGVFDPRSMQPGVPLTLTFGPQEAAGHGEAGQSHLMKVSLPTAVDQTVKIERGADDAFNASKEVLPLSREVARSVAVIRTSLYEDGVAAGLPPPLLAELIHAFSFDVDFQRDIQAGDRFELAYERFVDAGGHVAKTGNVVYASLTLSGRTLKIYRYQPKGGFADYFNEKGESVRKALLRTPVDGARLTSGFAMRKHPLLGFSRMHKGVDFGAPAGTPIMAAGDGVVEISTFNYSYGNYVRIRHSGQYGTAYAHMSRIASGIVKGARVRQGQVIGYVGATGLATGPHLHYEVLVNNVQVNPASIKAPTGITLAGAVLNSFEEERVKIDASLASLPLAASVARSAF
jgi:murein DD-endopeptidase MepM/ murein hydrolase activator NlpD